MGTVQKALALSGAYRRAAAAITYTLKEKRSEFIASLFPATDPVQARQRLEELRRQHHQANHNCPAWRIGFPETEEFCSDDGEPGGTAGRPILGALIKAELYDTAIVVTRYFGGIKLGVRGLIDAYSAAAAGAIESAALEMARPWRQVVLTSSYDRFNDLQRALRSGGLKGEQWTTQYGQEVQLTVKFAPEEQQNLERLLGTYETQQLQCAEPMWLPGIVVEAAPC